MIDPTKFGTENVKRRYFLEDLGEDERIKLNNKLNGNIKICLYKEGGRVRICLIWLQGPGTSSTEDWTELVSPLEGCSFLIISLSGCFYSSWN
jgi:hypothetical protein